MSLWVGLASKPFSINFKHTSQALKPETHMEAFIQLLSYAKTKHLS